MSYLLVGHLSQLIANSKIFFQGQSGNAFDFWNFVCGLRWMNPTLAPVMDALGKFWQLIIKFG